MDSVKYIRNLLVFLVPFVFFHMIAPYVSVILCTRGATGYSGLRLVNRNHRLIAIMKIKCPVDV